MFPRNITIDIDDVLLRNTEAFIAFLAQNGRQLSVENFMSRRIWEILGCTKVESEELILEYYQSQFFKDMEMMPGADRAISILRKHFPLYVVTGRPLTTEKDTLKLLNKYFNGSFEDVIFVGQYQKSKDEESAKKHIIEKKLSSLFCIEDDVDIVEQLHSVKVIIYTHPWNRDVDGAVRFGSWEKITDYILRQADNRMPTERPFQMF